MESSESPAGLDQTEGLQKVAVIGLGYIGLPTAAMFAASGKHVLGVDISQRVVDTVNGGAAHIEEGDLDTLVERVVRSGALRASTMPEAADAFIIAVPTPVDMLDGQHRPDVRYVEAAARSIAPFLTKGNLVIVESTSPVGTTAKVSRLLAEIRPDLVFPHQDRQTPDVHLSYCPERIIPGKMLRELVENDRIIGGMTARCREVATSLYGAFVRGDCLGADDKTAEMVKLTENAFRDVNIAFANELSMICGNAGMDAWEVIALANRHPRVSILSPGPGVGGHCIAVDPWFIVAGDPERARLIRTAREVNDAKPEYVLDQVRHELDRAPGAKAVCLGLTYKADVDDFRESPALEIANRLSAEYPGRVLCSDPYEDALAANTIEARNLAFREVEDAVAECDVVLMLVGHSAFRTLAYPAGKAIVDAAGFWRRPSPGQADEVSRA